MVTPCSAKAATAPAGVNFSMRTAGKPLASIVTM